MSARGRWTRVAMCFLVMAALAMVALVWFDVPLLKAVIFAIAAGCLIAAIYAWRLGRRIAKEINSVGREPRKR